MKEDENLGPGAGLAARCSDSKAELTIVSCGTHPPASALRESPWLASPQYCTLSDFW